MGWHIKACYGDSQIVQYLSPFYTFEPWIKP